MAIDISEHAQRGLSWRKRKDGTLVAYWLCPAADARGGFRPKTQMLWRGIEATEADKAAIARECRRLNDQVASARKGMKKPTSHFRRSGTVYFLQCGERIKIGFSTQLAKRVRNLGTAAAERMELLVAIPGTPDDERTLHHRFRRDRIKGEWFKASAPLLAFIDGQRNIPRTAVSNAPRTF